MKKYNLLFLSYKFSNIEYMYILIFSFFITYIIILFLIKIFKTHELYYQYNKNCQKETYKIGGGIAMFSSIVFFNILMIENLFINATIIYFFIGIIFFLVY
jgi:UDP-N-acetylmuramyl pentapeptide phosphotransferase/UDP-N-acetylglucosamine-1-phosphate transferase